MKSRVQLSIVITLLFVSCSFAAAALNGTASPMNNQFIPSEGTLNPIEVSVEGSIIDNYANISYEMFFDNGASSVDNEIEWIFELQDGIRLSNISIIRGNETFWGRASPEQDAISEYNESVAANETAVLVLSTYLGYQVSMNVEAGSNVTLTVYAEGILIRNLGRYSLEIPISTEGTIIADFNFELTIISHNDQIEGWSISGISDLDVTTFSGGMELEYSGESIVLPSEIVFEYAFERQVGGGQLLTYTNGSQNFFAYLLAPIITEVEEQANRQYVFVLDTSGSMGGGKIEQAKDAFNSMIDDLGDDDLFNVIAFESSVSSLWVEPHSGSESHKTTAKTWVNNLEAGGGTNFHGACIEGLETISFGDNVKAMLILSDGLPTAGSITNTEGILSAIREANTLGVSISTVAFGSSADESLMANIAAQNNGFYAKILAGDDAPTKLLDFYKIFATPIANNYDIAIKGGSLITSTQPLNNSAFFNGTEIVITGCFEDSISVNTTIDYISGTENYFSVAHIPDVDKAHVEYIWAQHRITYLLWLVSCEGETDHLRNQIVSLGLQYGIIVKGYTALILTVYDTEDFPDETYSDTYTTTTTYSTYPATATDAVVGTGTTSTNTDTDQEATDSDVEFAASNPMMSGVIIALLAVPIVISILIIWKLKWKS